MSTSAARDAICGEAFRAACTSAGRAL